VVETRAESRVRYLTDHGFLSFQSVFSPLIAGDWADGCGLISLLT